jgi:GNAT superfamily N-acetyltransferase
VIGDEPGRSGGPIYQLLLVLWRQQRYFLGPGTVGAASRAHRLHLQLNCCRTLSGVDTAGVEPAIAVMPPAAETAQRVLRAYFGELFRRYYGRAATEDEVTAAMRDDPSDDLEPPRGLLLVAQQDDTVLGCAGLRLLPGQVGEVTRVFVAPAARRRGLGSRLLRCVEDHARRHGVTTLRLDTHRVLAEARRLYASHGYGEVPPFSDSPYSDSWFAKTLS